MQLSNVKFDMFSSSAESGVCTIAPKLAPKKAPKKYVRMH